MWTFAVVGVGVLAISWLVTRKPSRDAAESQRKRAEQEIALLRCDLESSVREARRWFEMDLPKPAWESISDAFAILEALKPRIERDAWSTLQAQLLAAIPRALDAQPKPTPRPKQRRRIRRKSRGLYV